MDSLFLPRSKDKENFTSIKTINLVNNDACLESDFLILLRVVS